MLEELKKKVLQANLDLVKYHLVLFTWGNVSEKDCKTGYIVIKPSGVPYEKMTAEDMVVIDKKGKVIEGHLHPSSDTPTHLYLYDKYPSLGGITHTHSTYATSWAQAGRDIKAYGTTQADYFHGDIPCTRKLNKEEIEGDYEQNTGKVIFERFKDMNLEEIPGVLVNEHGVFAFGKDSLDSVYHATVIEECAKMAYLTESINKSVKPCDQYLLDKHYYRKHGEKAYYGQDVNKEKK